MAAIKIELAEHELIHIVGEYVKKTFDVSTTITVAWHNNPGGATVTASP